MSTNTLTCEEVIEQLFVYLDQEMDKQTSAEIDRHLERCRDCYTRAEFEKKLRQKVIDSVNVQAPESLQKRLRGLMSQF